MSYSLEEMKALAAAMDAIPKTEAEVAAFMADVDAGKYDELLAESCPSPAELAKRCIEKLKAEREKLRQELEYDTSLARQLAEREQELRTAYKGYEAIIHELEADDVDDDSITLVLSIAGNVMEKRQPLPGPPGV